MPRAAHRSVLALLAALALPACNGSTDFTVNELLTVDSSTTSYDGPFQVDLSQYKTAWDNRKHIKSLSIDAASVQGTIATVDAGNAASTGSGSLALRPDGGPTDGSEDVEIGSISNAAISPGTTYTVDGTNMPAASALLEGALKGSGKFSLVAHGTANAAPVNFTVDATLKVHVKYSVF